MPAGSSLTADHGHLQRGQTSVGAAEMPDSPRGRAPMDLSLREGYLAAV